MMKIGIITTYMDRRPGKGTAIFTHRLVEGLGEYRDIFDITLIHTEKIPEDPVYLHFKEIILPKVFVPKKKLFFSELYFFIQTWFRKDYKFDVLFFPYSRVHPFFWICSAKKIIFTPMDGGPHTAGFMQKGYGKPLQIPRIFKWRIDAFIALTEFGKQGIQSTLKVTPSKVFIVPCGVDQMYFDEMHPHLSLNMFHLSDEYILSVSRFDPHKNIKNMIFAFKILIEKFSWKGNLVFVGGRHSPEYSEEVLDLIKESGLEERVSILPFVEDELMPLLYKKASIMWFPSFYEGFGIPVIEAMASGTPVLISNRGSLPEVAGKAAIVANPDSPEDIATQTALLLKDDIMKANLKTQGLERAKIFTWKKATESLVKVLKSV